MTIQAVLLGIVTPIFLGAVFHLWRGGAIWRLGLYIVLAFAGFWIGHLAGTNLESEFLKVGSLQMGIGILGAILFLAVGYWLSNKRPEPEAPRPKKPTRSVRR